MRRETHKICLSGISGVERNKAIDIISTAIAVHYHKNVIVLNEGYASEAAIDQIPESVKVFIVCGEQKPQVEQPVDIVVIDGDIMDNGQSNEINKAQIERSIQLATQDSSQ